MQKKHKIGKILNLFRQNPYTYIIFRINFVVEKGDLIRIKSGYYTIRIGDYSEDELIVKLFPDAVLTMECALYAYGYIKRKPYGYQIAVDKNTSKSRFKLEFPQVTPFYAEPETLQSGVDRIDFGVYFSG